MRCTVCDRLLVAQREWNSMSISQRNRLNRTHGKAGGEGMCATDYRRSRYTSTRDSELKYHGGWVRDGAIMRPDPFGQPLDAMGETA